ncbi:hypothetical protein Moror_12714 [Moniliophthora roreri MCA 2997]|uniref:Uncharacterized protein n=1 Tax=Moniliophthora roreri (strain MCA 2997) TaxID=1381753 RepID=V2X8K9_MONRO|nr:hypothetical protein Moror_12714 [Moniliophthora roreri MCA 2997]
MSSIDLTFERSFYIGGQFTGILYGIHLVIFALSCHFLSRPQYGAKSASKFYIGYSIALLILWTIALSCNAVFGQLAWIDHRDVEGGPDVYIAKHISDAYNTLGTAAGIALNFLSDALLIYRCYVIYSSSWRIVSFPILLYLGALSMSILTIYESALPGANFFRGHAVDFGVPYVALTISLNIIVTLLICGRLLTARNQMKAILGPEYARTYTSIAAIMVESAAPFTILGIFYVITYARHSGISFCLVQIWGDFCAISPQLIILRVAMGKAWSKETSGTMTSTHMTFSVGDSVTEKMDAALELAYPTNSEATTSSFPSVRKGDALV